MRSAADVSESWSGNRRASSRPGLLTAALVFAAAVSTLALVSFSAAEGLLAWDLRFAYLPAAEAVLEGDSPYPALDDPILDEQKAYVYPPQLVITVLPLTFLPVDAVALFMTICMFVLLGLTLHLLGIRDIRCYAAALLWLPTVSGVLFSNLSIPLTLALAVVWRYRDATWPPAITLGLAVPAKLFLWPLFVWTLATRRVRATVLAVLIGLGVTFATWAAIGFAGLTGYPALLRRLSEIQAENSYSLVGIAATLGFGDIVGQALTLAVGGGLVAWCVVLARRGDEPRSFTCAIAATLALSPIIWLHYLVVLLVPLAIARPRFSLIWLLPVLLWASPQPGHAEGIQTFFPAIAAAILLAVLLARPRVGAVVAKARP